MIKKSIQSAKNYLIFLGVIIHEQAFAICDYDINKRADQLSIARVMLIAYQKAIDPQFLSQLEYLHFKEGMQIPRHTLDIISNLIKTTL